MFFKQMVWQHNTRTHIVIHSGAHAEDSRMTISNQNVAIDYVYQDVTLEANTQYTVSVYAAALMGFSYYNAVMK